VLPFLKKLLRLKTTLREMVARKGISEGSATDCYKKFTGVSGMRQAVCPYSFQ
jgi:hypothetical protein